MFFLFAFAIVVAAVVVLLIIRHHTISGYHTRGPIGIAAFDIDDTLSTNDHIGNKDAMLAPVIAKNY